MKLKLMILIFLAYIAQINCPAFTHLNCPTINIPVVETFLL